MRKAKGLVLISKPNEYTLEITRKGDWIELPYIPDAERGTEITFEVPKGQILPFPKKRPTS